MVESDSPLIDYGNQIGLLYYATYIIISFKIKLLCVFKTTSINSVFSHA
ncbi:hypothetical protein NIES2109_18500 [Nostoc sp. HK-01]|nr:hypothetical protein NIES2109_18500 [Nostoc sp. HK-01]